MKWKDKLFEDLLAHLQTMESKILMERVKNLNHGIHLAIFNEPFTTLILNNRKTVESRFSINRVHPFGIVKEGDVVVMKMAGGSVIGIFVARNLRYFTRLGANAINELKTIYGERAFWDLDPEFLPTKIGANFLTLMEITELEPLAPFEIAKKDRTGWALIREGFKDTLFEK